MNFNNASNRSGIVGARQMLIFIDSAVGPCVKIWVKALSLLKYVLYLFQKILKEMTESEIAYNISFMHLPIFKFRKEQFKITLIYFWKFSHLHCVGRSHIPNWDLPANYRVSHIEMVETRWLWEVVNWEFWWIMVHRGFRRFWQLSFLNQFSKK